MHAQEVQLLARIRAGEEDAFEALFREYYAFLCGFAEKFLQDHEAAEELVQDLFMQMWDRREELAPTTSLKSYLFTAVRNASFNQLKHRQVRDRFAEAVRAQPESYASDPETELEREELRARIAYAIDSLPERCREIFELSRYEGLKYQEIADRLSLSPRTVEVQIGKALRHLRDHLADYLHLGWLVFFLWEGYGYTATQLSWH